MSKTQFTGKEMSGRIVFTEGEAENQAYSEYWYLQRRRRIPAAFDTAGISVEVLARDNDGHPVVQLIKLRNGYGIQTVGDSGNFGTVFWSPAEKDAIEFANTFVDSVNT